MTQIDWCKKVGELIHTSVAAISTDTTAKFMIEVGTTLGLSDKIPSFQRLKEAMEDNKKEAVKSLASLAVLLSTPPEPGPQDKDDDQSLTE